jgi:hypothetical protein
MGQHSLLDTLVVLSTLAVVPEPGQAAEDVHGSAASVAIPVSVQAEHKRIREALIEATRLAGPVGSSARDLADVLHPHFVREEEIALPPLGLLAPLSAGEQPPGTEAALEMGDQLRRELPHMLEEHKRIRAAVEKLGNVARAEGNVEVSRLAEELALHARTEEEVLYPAAILVGDVIRARQRGE